MGKSGHCSGGYEAAGRTKPLALGLLNLPQSVRSWAEYLEYDREGKEGDPSLVGGFTSLIRLLLDRMGVTLWS